MKPYTLQIVMIWAAMTVALFAAPPTAKYLTKKSVWVSGRTMNNVVVVMECDDIKFVVPPGSIDPSLVVQIYREEGTLIVESGTPGDKIVRLAVETKQFDGPIEVHIPVKDPNKVPVAYAVDKSDAWERLTFSKLSPDKTTAIYLTQKPVTVAWVTPK